MSQKIGLFIAAVACFLAFILFSYLVHEDVFTQLDFNTTVRLQDNLTRRVDVFFSSFSEVGNFEVSTIFLFVLTFIIVFLRKKILAFGWIGAYGVFHIIELFGKTYVEHRPPPHFMLRTHDLVPLDHFYVSTDFSYPSGHSGRTVFFASLLLLMTWNSRKLTILSKSIISAVIMTYVVIMLVSRVYLGEHWLTDVIGGSLLGLSLGIASFWLILLPFSWKNLNPKTLFFTSEK